MPSNSADVIIRLIAKDEGLKEALKASGKQGEKFVRQLEDAGKKGGAGLKSVDNVAKDVKGSMNGLLQRLGPVGSALKGLGPIGFGAAAGLGALVVGATAAANAGEQAAKSIAAIGDAADEIGLSTDTYQTYVAVVKEGRVETAALEAALRAAAKTTAEAALGTGELYSNLILVNPELVKQVQTADSLEDRLKAVAKLYNEAGTEVERSTVLLRTFGDNGVRAGKLLLESGGDIDALKTKYEALGLILSEDLIRASQDAAGELEIANARMKVSQDKLKIAFSDFAVSTKEKMADLFTFLAKGAGVKSISEDISELTTRVNELNLSQIKAENSGRNRRGHGRKNYLDNEREIEQILAKIAALEAEQVALDEAAAARDKEAVEQAGLTKLKAALNRLREEAKTASERETEALIELNTAREKGLISSDAEYNRLRRLIAEKYKDVTVIRNQEKAERDKVKAAQEAARALEKGLEIRLKLTNADQRGLAVTEKVAAYQKDLTDNMKVYGLSQQQVTLAVDDYRASLDGSAQAQVTLASALAETLDPVARFNAETEKLEALQALANIPAEDFNRILAARAVLLDELQTREKEQAETDQFGESLSEAEKRIKDSLKTTAEIIDEKIELQKKIIEALGTSLDPDDAAEYLAKYRKELEEAADKTDDLRVANLDLNDVIHAAGQGWEEVGELILKTLAQIIIKMALAKDETQGFGDILGSILGGGGSGSGGGFSQIFGDIFGSGGGDFLAGVFHKGSASVGGAAPQTRKVPAAIFEGAPRYHRGSAAIGRNEVPAILEKGERVTTESDSRALVNAINASTMMSARGRSGDGGFKLTVINSGEPVEADVQDNGVDAQGQREFTLMLRRAIKSEVPSALASPAAANVLAQTYGVRKSVRGR